MTHSDYQFTFLCKIMYSKDNGSSQQLVVSVLFIIFPNRGVLSKVLSKVASYVELLLSSKYCIAKRTELHNFEL